MNELEEYLKQDVFNPKYLFHGTAHEIEKLECRQSTDSENKDNEDILLKNIKIDPGSETV